MSSDKSGKSSANTDKPKVTAKKVKKAHVLNDDKKLQALAILYGSAKMNYAEWCRVLFEIDESRLTETLLDQLRQAIPEADVMKKLRTEIDDSEFDQLPEGEQFAFKLSSIKMLGPRLDSICFKLQFEDLINDTKPAIVAVTAACEEVKNSRGFATFIELTLLTGNYMNSSAKNYKDTFAFEMSFLSKLSTVKTMDGNSNLLNFLVDWLSTRERHLMNFTESDLHHVAKASKVVPDQVQKTMNSMGQSIRKLENMLKTYQQQTDNDRFLEIMKPFLNKAQVAFDLLTGMHDKMKDVWKELAGYYAIDQTKYGMEDFFTDVTTFKDQYEKELRNRERKKEAEEKQKRLKEAKEPVKRERRKLLDMSTAGGDQQGLMDNLLDALSTGVAFPQRAKSPAKRPTPRSKDKIVNLHRKRSRCAQNELSVAMAVDENRNISAAGDNRRADNNDKRNNNRDPAGNKVRGSRPQRDNLIDKASFEDLMTRLQQL